MIQKETGWPQVSCPSSLLLSLAANRVGHGQSPALTITHTTLVAPWLRAQRSQAQANSTGSSHSTHQWSQRQPLRHVPDPPPRSGTSTAGTTEPLFDTEPASTPAPCPRERRGMPFHSGSPVTNVVPHAMPNKPSQGDLPPVLDPPMLTPATLRRAAPSTSLHPK